MPTILRLSSQEISVNKPKSLIQTIPFCVIFLSLIIFSFKLYFLSVSHSNIFNTTKFWFVVSNIIILIIAADFGAFCSSSKDDLCTDYPKDNHYQYQLENDQIRSLSLPKLHTPKIAESVYSKQGVDQLHEEVKDIVVYEETKSSKYTMANHNIVYRSAVGNKPIKKFREGDIVHQLAWKVHKDEKIDQERRKTLPCPHLSMSDGGAAVARNDHTEKKMNVLYRSKTENFDANTEDNEFSSMSNEELNRRVEEFIKRCNRQIRLEAVGRKFQEV